MAKQLGSVVDKEALVNGMKKKMKMKMKMKDEELIIEKALPNVEKRKRIPLLAQKDSNTISINKSPVPSSPVPTSLCRACSKGAVCFIGNDGRVSAASMRLVVCKNPTCSASNPEYLLASMAPKKYLLSRKNQQLIAHHGPKPSYISKAMEKKQKPKKKKAESLTNLREGSITSTMSSNGGLSSSTKSDGHGFEASIVGDDHSHKEEAMVTMAFDGNSVDPEAIRALVGVNHEEVSIVSELGLESVTKSLHVEHDNEGNPLVGVHVTPIGRWGPDKVSLGGDTTMALQNPAILTIPRDEGTHIGDVVENGDTATTLQKPAILVIPRDVGTPDLSLNPTPAPPLDQAKIALPNLARLDAHDWVANDLAPSKELVHHNDNDDAPPSLHCKVALVTPQVSTMFAPQCESTMSTLPDLNTITPLDPGTLVIPNPKLVTLRKQQTRDTKEAHEWMLNHEITRLVHKLNPDGNTKVKILVEAFEALISHTTLEATRSLRSNLAKTRV